MPGDACRESDLATGWTKWLLWRVPYLFIVAGLMWTSLLPDFWFPAFAVMGTACVFNAARCGRTHCYITGPLFLMAAAYVALASMTAVPLAPGVLLLVVLGVGLLSRLVESRVGRYRQAL